ncbi:hypothetical protein DD238_003640 [Peronospora effusa]|uniref:WW domain-containing protein n=1 Tax=Peronospora effusa TaxID=542832 RepID=A0A3M6VFK6_9STRA|nr:hypothetical protein DD238_003640 [Peronospora effusa]
MGTSHTNAEQHLDNYASASGLMQLSSVALVAATDGNNSSSSNTVSETADTSLPSGWQQIIHGSGLPCYVHNGLGVVCWTRPYLLGLGYSGTLSQSELHRLVKQHVPPLNTFASTSGEVIQRQRSDSTADCTSSSMSVSQEPDQSKKRKLDVLVKEQKSSDSQPSMTLEEFKKLSISDPCVLQACMELSIKTPAQVLQEYQNRNRGVSINYNTVPLNGGGVKLFKTIVTAGSTVAEGVASTKKIAKQLAAQQVLAILHEHTAQRYHEVAEMYNNSLKCQSVITESSTYGPTIPLRNDARGGRNNEDLRHQRGGNASNRMRRARRLPPNQEYNVSGGYRECDVDRRGNVPPNWSPYNQQSMQLGPQQAGLWDARGQQNDAGMINGGPERVVVYSTTPAGSTRDYSGGQYYNNAHVGGNVWGRYPNANHPPIQPNLSDIYPQQYSGGYEIAQPLPEQNRPYGNYHSSDRPNTSIERVTGNLRNQMSNQ